MGPPRRDHKWWRQRLGPSPACVIRMNSEIIDMNLFSYLDGTSRRRKLTPSFARPIASNGGERGFVSRQTDRSGPPFSIPAKIKMAGRTLAEGVSLITKL